MEEVKFCKGCGKEMSPSLPYFTRKKYCHSMCKTKMLWAEYSKKNGYGRLPPSTVGAMHEMVVCIDLIKKGFNVFRAISPACPFDLVIFKNNEMKKIEVKTGYKLSDGKLSYPKNSDVEVDIWAVVLHGGEILYFPENSIV